MAIEITGKKKGGFAGPLSVIVWFQRNRLNRYDRAECYVIRVNLSTLFSYHQYPLQPYTYH